MMRSVFLLAIVTCSAVVLAQRDREREPRDNTMRECFGKVADVFFVLDSSSSIYVMDYRTVLDFVSQVITRFDVSRDDTRVGALTFSDDFQVGFDLNNFPSKGQVLASINERTLPYRTGMTKTDLAIRRVRQDSQFRNDITKVIVVITDGGSWSPAETRRQSDLARQAGFHMVVVGVGQYLDEQEWRAIASDPDNDYIFNITNFNFLESIRDSLPRRICLMPPIIIGGECRVRENADLLFLAGANGKNDALDVAEGLSDSFRPSDRMRVSYIMEACQEDAIDSGFEGPGRYCNRHGDALPQDEDTYLNLVSRLRSQARSMRDARQANQVAVLFVDDQFLSENRFRILQEVRNAMQFDGISIIVVDLGVRSFRNLVISMTSHRENIINYNTFEDQGLQQSVQDILDRVCEYANFRFGEVIPS
uniref:VWACP-4 n=1 Tax=Colubraria reticulata TaxID=604273 RepID=A0AA96V2E3_9CAEN|nr:VWACP-4 [Colubraria reticulata]